LNSKNQQKSLMAGPHSRRETTYFFIYLILLYIVLYKLKVRKAKYINVGSGQHKKTTVLNSKVNVSIS